MTSSACSSAPRCWSCGHRDLRVRSGRPMSGVRLVWAYVARPALPGLAGAAQGVTTVRHPAQRDDHRHGRHPGRDPGLLSTSTDALFAVLRRHVAARDHLRHHRGALHRDPQDGCPRARDSAWAAGRSLSSSSRSCGLLELSLFRDASFKDPWLYAAIMVAIGAVHLGYLLVTRGRHGLKMPEMASIDANRPLGNSPPRIR